MVCTQWATGVEIVLIKGNKAHISVPRHWLNDLMYMTHSHLVFVVSHLSTGGRPGRVNGSLWFRDDGSTSAGSRQGGKSHPLLSAFIREAGVKRLSQYWWLCLLQNVVCLGVGFITCYSSKT